MPPQPEDRRITLYCVPTFKHKEGRGPYELIWGHYAHNPNWEAMVNFDPNYNHDFIIKLMKARRLHFKNKLPSDYIISYLFDTNEIVVEKYLGRKKDNPFLDELMVFFKSALLTIKHILPPYTIQKDARKIMDNAKARQAHNNIEAR